MNWLTTELTPEAQLIGAIGDKLLALDQLRVSIDVDRFEADRDRLQQTFALFAFAVLIGAAIGFAAITHGVLR